MNTTEALAPDSLRPVCSACGQIIAMPVKTLYYTSELIHRTITGKINASCPQCNCNMRHAKVAIGYFYKCSKCHQWWRLET